MINMVLKGKVINKDWDSKADALCAVMVLRVSCYALGDRAEHDVEVWFPKHMKQRVSWFLNTDVSYVMVVANAVSVCRTVYKGDKQPLFSVLASDIDR